MNHLENAFELWKQNIQDLTDLKRFFDIEFLNNQFYRKLLLRNIYSVIESYLYVTRELIKHKALMQSSEEDYKLSYEELAILNGKTVILTSKGEPKANEIFFSFEPSLKFTLNTFSKIYKADNPDYSDNNYEKLIKLSKRRNDLTHPKLAQLQIVTSEEIKHLVLGLQWFLTTHAKISKNIKF